MGLLTSNEQGRPFLLNHSIYSKHRHPPLLSRSQETLEVCLSQGSSYESHTGGLDSRRLCGPGPQPARTEFSADGGSVDSGP